jgi:phage terminase large subunit-like protein
LKVATVWTAHLKDPAHRAKFLEDLSYQFQTHTLKRFIEIIEQKRAAKEKDRINDYESPAWPYQQAHFNGYIQALTELLQLIPDPKE